MVPDGSVSRRTQRSSPLKCPQHQSIYASQQIRSLRQSSSILFHRFSAACLGIPSFGSVSHFDPGKLRRPRPSCYQPPSRYDEVLVGTGNGICKRVHLEDCRLGQKRFYDFRPLEEADRGVSLATTPSFKIQERTPQNCEHQEDFGQPRVCRLRWS